MAAIDERDIGECPVCCGKRLMRRPATEDDPGERVKCLGCDGTGDGFRYILFDLFDIDEENQ